MCFVVEVADHDKLSASMRDLSRLTQESLHIIQSFVNV